MLTLLAVGMLTLASYIQQVKASGTIYIRADGSVDPPSAPIERDGDVYTLKGNITSDTDIYTLIAIQRSNIVVDGAGYTVQGTGASWSEGIYLSDISNVTIMNLEIKKFAYAIYLDNSSDNIIHGNNITGSKSRGISLFYSSNNIIYGNNVTNNGGGIDLSLESSYNRIYGNEVTANNLTGIELSFEDSKYNIVYNNNITANNWHGIALTRATNTSVYGNNIIANNYEGIFFDSGTNYNNIFRNKITNNRSGLLLLWSSNNTISGNNITANNESGISLRDTSHTNRIYGNNITNNRDGIDISFQYFEPPSNNYIYHNNFIDNTRQVYNSNPINTWDDGFASGGNYWSDYEERYPTAKELDGSGIWDTPYVIDGKNQDNYPLMDPWFSPPLHALAINSIPAGVPFTVDDASRTTPWLGTYNEGTSVSLVMPVTYDGYVWSHWLEDGDINTVKAITVYTSITLTAVFTPDTMPPTISILSPENTTYTIYDVSLTFILSEPASWICYSINGQANVTITGNTTLPDLPDGMYNLIVYAKDAAGNIGASEIIYFTMQTQATPLWMQWWFWTIMAVIFVAVAGAVYFLKKRKRSTTTPLPPEGTDT